MRFGISLDSVASHNTFSDKNKLNFPILSDRTTDVCRAYGRLSFMGFSKRVTFVVGSAGRIVNIELGVDIDKHAEQLMQHFDQLRRQHQSKPH